MLGPGTWDTLACTDQAVISEVRAAKDGHRELGKHCLLARSLGWGRGACGWGHFVSEDPWAPGCMILADSDVSTHCAKCGPQSSCIRVPWEYVRNAASQAPPQTH